MPKIKDIEESMIARFSAAYGQQVPLYQNAFLRMVSKVVAGGLAVAYQFINYTKAQGRIRTASMVPEDFRGATVSPLVEWGRTVGLGDPKPANNAVVIALVTNEAIDDELPSGSLLENSVGTRYTTTEDAVFFNHIAQVSCICNEPGELGNDIVGGLKVIDPPSGIQEDAGVAQLQTAGVDAESEVDYRARVLAWFQRRALGGALADYWAWALTVPGIVKAYPTRGDAGVVEVRVQASESSSGSVHGIPTPAQITQVTQAIEYDPNEGITPKATRRPVGAAVSVLPITMSTYDIEVHGVTGVGSEDTFRTRLKEHLEDYFSGREPFVFGLTTTARKDAITSTNVTAEVSQVCSANGGQFVRALITKGGAPVYAESLNTGLATLGTLTINFGA